MIKRIILPTDFSNTAQNAFRYALCLADDLGAQIQLLHVAYPEYAATDLPVMSGQSTKIKLDLAKEAMQSFVDFGLAQVQLAHTLEHLPRVGSDLELGNPSSVIKRVARRDKADLIICGTRGEHSPLEKTFGSFTTELLRSAEVPVVVVPEDARYTGMKQIAFASELREEDPHHIWRTMQLLPFEAQWHIIHVQVPGKAEGEARFGELQQMVKGGGRPTPSLHLMQADTVAEGLEAFTEKHRVDAMVMLARHPHIWERIFYRSKTRAMAYQTQVPLLVIQD